jgi:rRNA processing protein Gar1
MFLPKGKDVWSNLKTFFVDIDRLLLFLKNQEFIGYIHVVFPDTQGVIFLQEGDVVGGIQDNKENRNGGPDAVKGILERARTEQKASISVSNLSLKTVTIISDVFGFPVKIMHKNLSSDFSDLGRFVAKLGSEEFTGYIEIHFSKDRKEGIIYLEKGKIKASLTEEIQIGLGNESQEDLKVVYSKIIEEAKRVGALFDVFGPT